MKIILSIILMSMSFLAWGGCEVSESEIKTQKLALNNLLSKTNKKNAKEYFTIFPSDFCKFNNLYGYPRDADFQGKPAALYESELVNALPSFERYLKPELILTKYVKIASQAKWDSDNVAVFQQSYKGLIYKNINDAINVLQKLPNNEQYAAVRFIYDGPHPSNTIKKDTIKPKVCTINKSLCSVFESVHQELLANEKH